MKHFSFKSECIYITWKCSKCDYEVTKKYLLEKHMLKHNVTLECTLCDYKTEDQQDLDLHFFSHTGEMPVSCYMCKYKVLYSH